MPKIKERWKRKPHIPSFISNGRPAQGTADFAWKDSFMLVEVIIVKVQVFESFCYSHIPFMKYGGPLHGRSMQFLACQTMAYLGIYRIRTYFVLYGTAKAACPVFCFEINIRNGRIIRSEFFFHVYPCVDQNQCKMVFDFQASPGLTASDPE